MYVVNYIWWLCNISKIPNLDCCIMHKKHFYELNMNKVSPKNKKLALSTYSTFVVVNPNSIFFWKYASSKINMNRV